jgi:hypothetical protein
MQKTRNHQRNLSRSKQDTFNKKHRRTKILSANYLPKEHIVARISLLYDALRELLEAQALEKGYKIYNHECYTAFIKEILKKSPQGDTFDSLRKIRNGINYYGKDVSTEEAEHIINNLKKLIEEFS